MRTPNLGAGRMNAGYRSLITLCVRAWNWNTHVGGNMERTCTLLSTVYPRAQSCQSRTPLRIFWMSFIFVHLKKISLCIDLRERGMGERDNLPTSWFTLQMATVVWAEPNWNQEPGIWPWSPIWMAGAQTHVPTSASFPGKSTCCQNSSSGIAQTPNNLMCCSTMPVLPLYAFQKY